MENAAFQFDNSQSYSIQSEQNYSGDGEWTRPWQTEGTGNLICGILQVFNILWDLANCSLARQRIVFVVRCVPGWPP